MARGGGTVGGRRGTEEERRRVSGSESNKKKLRNKRDKGGDKGEKGAGDLSRESDERKE